MTRQEVQAKRIIKVLMQILVWPKIFLTILENSFMENLTSLNCVIPTEIAFLCNYKLASRYVEF